MSDTVYHNFSNLVIIEALKKLVWQKWFFYMAWFLFKIEAEFKKPNSVWTSASESLL